ncbi:CHAT domain-containing protein [Streptomyces sp. NPDC021224]|uniref:CHAT domain-containing protein n=1 Tax=unclassified Streptomyces TaxID=2593676 RepID=UPI00379CAB69
MAGKLTRRLAARFGRGDPQEVRAAELTRELSRLVPGSREELELRLLLGNYRWSRAMRDPADPDHGLLEAAVDLLTPCVAAGSRDVPLRLLPLITEQDPVYRALQRWMDSPTLADRTRAVELMELSCGALTPDYPDAPWHLSTLGFALMARHRLTGGADDLDAAVEYLKAALEQAVGQDDAQDGSQETSLRTVFKLCDAYLARYDLRADGTPDAPAEADDVRIGDLEEDLKEAEGWFTEGLRQSPGAVLPPAGLIARLGLARLRHFRRTSSLLQLNLAVTTVELLVVTLRHDPLRPVAEALLGDLLRERFACAGNGDDLARAHALSDAAARPAAEDHAARVEQLSALWPTPPYRQNGPARPPATPDADADADSTPLRRRVLPRRAGESPEGHALFLLSAAGEAAERFRSTGRPEDIDDAVEYARQALDGSTDEADRASVRGLLTVLLKIRHDQLGRPEDLAELGVLDHGGALLRSLADWTEKLDEDQAEAMLSTRLGDTVVPSEEALRLIRASGAPVAEFTGTEVGRLAATAETLRTRFHQTRQAADLDRAVAAAEALMAGVPADDRDLQAAARTTLALAYFLRAEHDGDADALVETVRLFREAVPLSPAGLTRGVVQSNLVAALAMRYGRTGDGTVLHEAVDTARAGLRQIPADDPRRTTLRTHLSMVLRLVFEHFGDVDALEEAVEEARAAALTPLPDDFALTERTVMWALALSTRARVTKSRADSDRSVALLRQARADVPEPDALTRDRLGYVLGLLLNQRYLLGRSRPDLDEAIRLFEVAGGDFPEGRVPRSMIRSQRAVLLEERFRLDGGQENFEAAVAAHEDCWRAGHGTPFNQVASAIVAAQMLARADPYRAARAAEAAVRLLPEVAPRHLVSRDQQRALRQFTDLAADAAALVLSGTGGTRQERATRALQVLETGRGVLLSQSLDTRSDLTDLHRAHPELAAQFVDLRDRLDAAAGADVGFGTPAVTGPSGTADRHPLAHALAQVLATIRSTPGFSSFALPPEPAALLTEAAEGPIAVVNVSSYRCDALLLTGDGIDVLPLPGLTYEELRERTSGFRQALQTLDSGTDRRERIAAQRTLTGLLGWLWDEVAEPVLEALGLRRAPEPGAEWPRMWWVTGGLLGLLPLHAAGHHRDPANGTGADGAAPRTVLDRVVPSYTPTVRALAHARRQTAAGGRPAHGLVVAVPSAPGQRSEDDLGYVDREAGLVLRHLDGAVLLRSPGPADRPGDPALPSAGVPTRSAVLARLPQCAIAHFCCHTRGDAADPSLSTLVLHDHASAPFTVGALTAVRLDDAQLAYLSACRTGVTDDTELTDESIHLGSAFQLAGFPRVVATQWEQEDQTAALVADDFYRHLAGPSGEPDPRRAAEALHRAVRALRDGADLPPGLDRRAIPHLWAPYTHTGA